MVTKLRNKIVELEQLLSKRGSKTSDFFKKLGNQLTNNNILDVVNSIIHSYSLIQYADFNYKEESLFSEIWEIANQLKKDLPPNEHS